MGVTSKETDSSTTTMVWSPLGGCKHIQIEVMSSSSMDNFWSSFRSVERGLGTRNRWTYFNMPDPMDAREEQHVLHILAGITTYRIQGGTFSNILPPPPPLNLPPQTHPLYISHSPPGPHQQPTAQRARKGGSSPTPVRLPSQPSLTPITYI